MALANSTTTSFVALPSAARTTTTTSDVINNPHSSNINVWFRVTAGPGTAAGVDTLQLDLQFIDPASGVWQTVNTAGGTGPIQLDGTSSLTYNQKVWWGIPTAQNSTSGSGFQFTTLQAFLGPQLRVRVAHGGTSGTGSWTYSVGVALSAS